VEFADARRRPGRAIQLYGWQPVYCVSYNTQDRVKELLPATIYHDTYDARFGRPASQLAGMPLSVIDQPTAQALHTPK